MKRYITCHDKLDRLMAFAISFGANPEIDTSKAMMEALEECCSVEVPEDATHFCSWKDGHLQEPKEIPR